MGTEILAPLYVDARNLKMLRETLCRAQAAADRNYDLFTYWYDIDQIQLLINEIDRHRPLTSDGTHGMMHTPTCGCEDK